MQHCPNLCFLTYCLCVSIQDRPWFYFLECDWTGIPRRKISTVFYAQGIVDFFFFLRAQLELKSVISSEMWVMDSRLGAITGSYHHHVVMETNYVNCSEAAVRCVWKWLMIGTHLHYLLMQICGTCLLSLSLQMPVSRSFFMGQISPKHVWISLPDANCIFWFNHAKA